MSNNLEDQLRMAIADSGYSANELARASGVAQPVLTRFINGSRGMTLSTASRVARVLGLELVAKRKGR